MKKTTLFLTTTMILGLGATALATPGNAATVDGENSADVIINGTIGKLDNTDPEVDIPEGSDEWINVTVDTATAFHTTTASAHQSIESADYSIVNNSGRAVAVTLNNITGTPAAPVYVDRLTINAKGDNLIAAPTATNLVDNNAFASLASSPVWMRLANNEGRFNIENDAANAYGNSATFFYTGETVADLPANVNETTTAENYTLTLKFTSIQKDGVTLGVTP